MSDSPNEGQRQRRASWVGLRTLRQRPRVVGETAGGDTIFEVRSVRLVLRGDAGHFNRLVRCSKCEDDVAGSPVFTADDLDRSPSPVICQRCVKESGASGAWRPEERRTVAPALNEKAAAPADVVPRGGARVESRDDDLAVMTRLAQVTEAVERRPTEEANRSAVATAVSDALAQARTELASSTEATAARLDALEEHGRQDLLALARLLDGQRAEIDALASSAAEARAEVARVNESQRRLAEAQKELDRRVVEVAARPVPAEAAPPDLDGVHRRVDEVQAELTRLIETTHSQVHEALERRFADARSEGTAREQDLQHGMSRLSAMVAALRSELETSIDKAVRSELDAVARGQAELSAAQAEVDRRLEAMASSIEAAGNRVHAVEQSVQEAVRRLVGGLERATAPVVPVERGTGSLLESLDAQLRAAESRLAHHAGVPRLDVLIAGAAERGVVSETGDSPGADVHAGTAPEGNGRR